MAVPSPTYTPTRTPKHFSPEDPKFLSGSPRLKIKLILFRKFFSPKLQLDKQIAISATQPIFFRMLENFHPKIRPVVKSWVFYQTKISSPKVSVGLVRAGSTTLLKPFCQKVESILFKVREHYDIVNIWKKVKKHFWKRRMQFWQHFSEISYETAGIIAQNTKVTKTFLKNLLSLRRFYWLRKHKNCNRAANFLLSSENPFVKTWKKNKRHVSRTNIPQNKSVDMYNVVLAIPSRYNSFFNRHSRATYWISENK